MAPLTLTIIVCAAALVFDFINGFHDASNSIATIVATRVLKYRQAVIYAAFFNFIAFFTFSTGVARMIGAGLMQPDHMTLTAILAGLLGGIAWNLITWWRGIPASSSHTLIGALAGAVYTHSALAGDWNPAHIFIAEGWIKVLAFIFIAPLIGYALAFIVHRGAVALRARVKPEAGWSKIFAGAQLVSSAALSFNHGTNDAQKTAGVIAIALVTGGFMDAGDFHIPLWVLFLANLFIALGTWVGGWRITKTMGFRLAKLRPMDGFAAETGAALSIALATAFHLPVSTTLSTTGAIAGVGSAQGLGFNHAVFKKIFLTWCVTLPVSFAFGAGVMAIGKFLFGA
jgi:PiT family inorganic phosphate transporter